MSDYDNILKELCKREDNSNLFNIKIEDVPIYYYFRRYTHNEELKLHNYSEVFQHPKVGLWEYRKTVFKSLLQIFSLVLCRKKFDSFIYSFYRTDKVNGVFMDKFTDPLIDESNVGKSYIIFEEGRAGRHLCPRLHNNKVIYSDAVNWFAQKLWKYKKNKFAKRNKQKIEELYNELVKTFPEVNYNKDAILRILVKISIYQKIYGIIFKSIHAKFFIAPSRADFLHLIPIAKQANMKVMELQHGVTYGETLTYSGYFHPLFSPDYFLSFGKIHSAKCYGTSNDKVIEIGWAFEKFIMKLEIEKDNKQKVLVVSSPAHSEKIVAATCFLASQNPNILFFFRPHPNEQLDDNRLMLLNDFSNVKIDNNHDNIIVTLMRYDNVIGENSTALYEALSMGKKVGKLNMEGLQPKYLVENDICYFYEIKNNDDFIQFINAPQDGKPFKKIYTFFKPEVVNQLLIS